MDRSRRRPSPAIVVAVLAVVAAVAGTAVASDPVATTAKLKKKDKMQVKKIARKQIDKLAPSLSVAHADSAGSASTAETSTTANSATNAQNAANADRLGGQRATAFASSIAEPDHEVGSPGEPGFQNGWENWTGQPNFETAGFFKDPWGIVHLKGVVDGGTSNPVFTLPPGYRPGKNLLVVIHRFSGPASMSITTGGAINPLTGSGNASLDGVTFRAGP